MFFVSEAFYNNDNDDDDNKKKLKRKTVWCKTLKNFGKIFLKLV